MRFYYFVSDDALSRFLQSGARHMVLTSEDAFAIGGHFYNHGTFYNTMQSLVYEHYFGPWITNSGHLTSGVILFRLAASYRRILETGRHVEDGEHVRLMYFSSLNLI